MDENRSDWSLVATGSSGPEDLRFGFFGSGTEGLVAQELASGAVGPGIPGLGALHSGPEGLGTEGSRTGTGSGNLAGESVLKPGSALEQLGPDSGVLGTDHLMLWVCQSGVLGTDLLMLWVCHLDSESAFVSTGRREGVAQVLMG